MELHHHGMLAHCARTCNHERSAETKLEASIPSLGVIVARRGETWNPKTARDGAMRGARIGAAGHREAEYGGGATEPTIVADFANGDEETIQSGTGRAVLALPPRRPGESILLTFHSEAARTPQPMSACLCRSDARAVDDEPVLASPLRKTCDHHLRLRATRARNSRAVATTATGHAFAN